METPYGLAQTTSALPQPVQAALSITARGSAAPLALRVLRFLAVGLIGLGVDAGVFTLVFDALGGAAPLARAASLICATGVTWALNRLVTFAPSGRTRLHEATRYGLVALVAQGFNYVCFLILLHVSGATSPLVVLVAAAALTAAVSFTGQSLFAFQSIASNVISKR